MLGMRTPFAWLTELVVRSHGTILPPQFKHVPVACCPHAFSPDNRLQGFVAKCHSFLFCGICDNHKSLDIWQGCCILPDAHVHVTRPILGTDCWLGAGQCTMIRCQRLAYAAQPHITHGQAHFGMRSEEASTQSYFMNPAWKAMLQLPHRCSFSMLRFKL